MPRKKAVPENSVFEEPLEEPETDIIKPTADLTIEQKKLFADLLRKHSSLEDRARQLIKLASFTDTKRAPVALRAIQEINSITGISKQAAEESSPMFELPEGTEMAVAVKVPRK